MHLSIENHLVLMFLREVDGKRDVVVGIGDDDRNTDIALDDVQINANIFIGSRSEETTIRHGKKFHAFAFLHAYLIEKQLGIIHQLGMSLHRFCPHRHLTLLLQSKSLDKIIGIIHGNDHYHDSDDRESDFPPFLLRI